MTVAASTGAPLTSSATGEPLAPVVSDMSTYLIGGRVRSAPPEDPRLGRSVRQGVLDGVIAEQLGFRRVFLSERHDIKEAGVILGGVGALTSRLEIGTGAVSVTSREPRMMAAFGATMHAAYGPRFILGLGRGTAGFMGQKAVTYQALTDFTDIIRRLWRGERIDYAGPAGEYRGLVMQDVYEGPAPEIWGVLLGGPKACRTAANIYDGVILNPFLTAEAVHNSVTWIREECARIDRDPASIRICHPIVTACELDDLETRLLCHARAVTYFQYDQGEVWMRLNGWPESFCDKLREHAQLQAVASADQHFHRTELLGPASLIPDEWMQDTCGIGTPDECVKTLQRYRDAGVDEVTLYGSAPPQNASLIAAWRNRPRAAS
jgi:probable F420-dependent oxidoreductase